MKMYYDKDADLKVLKGKKVAIIGPGAEPAGFRGGCDCLRDAGDAEL